MSFTYCRAEKILAKLLRCRSIGIKPSPTGEEGDSIAIHQRFQPSPSPEVRRIPQPVTTKHFSTRHYLVVALLTVIFGTANTRAGDRVSPLILDPTLSGTTMEGGTPPRTGVMARETFGLALETGGHGIEQASGVIQLAQALPVAGPNGELYMEAERAEHVESLPGSSTSSLKRDNTASDGAFLDQPLIMAISFRIQTAGPYIPWVRCREGHDQDNRIIWILNARRSSYVSTQLAGKSTRAWHWQRLDRNELRLTKGDHRLRLYYAHKGAFQFDRIAFLPPDVNPQGPGPQQVSIQCDEGYLKTRAIMPPSILGIEKVNVRGELNGGSVAYDVSLDHGKTWLSLLTNPLSELRLTGDGSDAITFRATLKRSPDGFSPRLSGVDLTVQPKPSAWLAVRNDHLRVLVDGEQGRLFRVTDVKRQRELIWTAAPFSMFEIDLKERGKATWVRYSDDKTSLVTLKGVRAPREVEEAEGLDRAGADQIARAAGHLAVFEGGSEMDGRIAMNFTVEQDVALTLGITLDNTGQSLWTVQIENRHPNHDVIRATFPRFETFRLGADGLDDHQTRCQTFGWHRRIPSRSCLRNVKYPGELALPWESNYDQRGGFGIIVRDQEATNVGFESTPSGGGGDTISLHVRKYDCVQANGGNKRWECAIAVHPGQWHWVADRYREWALGHMVRPVYPAWFGQSDGYYMCDLMNRRLGFSDFARYFATRARKLGLLQLQVWGQFTGHRHGCCGPYWQPSPAYGTLEQFQQMIQQVHAMGLKIGFYMIHDRIDLYHARGSHIYGFIPKSAYPPNTEFPTEEFFNRVQHVSDPAGVKLTYPLSEEDWKEYHRKLMAHRRDPQANKAPEKWHPVDLNDAAWWEYIRRWAIDKYGLIWRADGLYNDVLGVGSTRESYDLRKNQHGHGQWGKGKAGIARTIIESARRKGMSDYFQIMEGLSDIPGQWCAAANIGIYLGHSETMRYTWPDLVIFEGSSGKNARRPLLSIDTAWLNGNRFDMRISNTIFARIVTARASIRDWIYRARFLDSVGLSCPVPARLFLRREPNATGAVVTFNNRESKSATVELQRAVVGDLHRAVAINHLGMLEAVQLQRIDDTYRFKAPTGRFSAVVLVERADLQNGLIASIFVNRSPTISTVIVRLANVTGQDINGRVIPRDTGPYTGLPPQHFQLRSDEVAVLTFPLRGAAHTFVRPRFEIEANGATIKQVDVPILPYIEDPSFETIGNEGHHRFAGVRSWRLDPRSPVRHKRIWLDLEPSRMYRINFAYKRAPTAPGANLVRIIQKLEDNQPGESVESELTVSNRWMRTAMLFPTGRKLVHASMYIYNNRKGRMLWIDDFRVEDLGSLGSP